MSHIVGFIIGVVSGAAQFWLLTKFTNLIIHGTFGLKTAAYGLAQFMLPIVTLLICAFTIKHDLVWVGTGIVSALVVPALYRFIAVKRQR